MGSQKVGHNRATFTSLRSYRVLLKLKGIIDILILEGRNITVVTLKPGKKTAQMKNKHLRLQPRDPQEALLSNLHSAEASG